MSLTFEKNTGDLLFRNPSRTQNLIVTFSLGQKGCEYLGKFDYLGCDYYELRQ